MSEEVGRVLTEARIEAMQEIYNMVLEDTLALATKRDEWAAQNNTKLALLFAERAKQLSKTKDKIMARIAMERAKLVPPGG
jgi:hypothetical protein